MQNIVIIFFLLSIPLASSKTATSGSQEEHQFEFDLVKPMKQLFYLGALPGFCFRHDELCAKAFNHAKKFIPLPKDVAPFAGRFVSELNNWAAQSPYTVAGLGVIFAGLSLSNGIMNLQNVENLAQQYGKKEFTTRVKSLKYEFEILENDFKSVLSVSRTSADDKVLVHLLQRCEKLNLESVELSEKISVWVERFKMDRYYSCQGIFFSVAGLGASALLYASPTGAPVLVVTTGVPSVIGFVLNLLAAITSQQYIDNGNDMTEALTKMQEDLLAVKHRMAVYCDYNKIEVPELQSVLELLNAVD
jgi:hypothetical protein